MKPTLQTRKKWSLASGAVPYAKKYKRPQISTSKFNQFFPSKPNFNDDFIIKSFDVLGKKSCGEYQQFSIEFTAQSVWIQFGQIKEVQKG